MLQVFGFPRHNWPTDQHKSNHSPNFKLKNGIFSTLTSKVLFKCTWKGRNGWSRSHTGMPYHLSHRTDSQGENQGGYQWDPSPIKAQETHREMRGVVIIWPICNFFTLPWVLGSYSFGFLDILSSIKIIKMKLYRIAPAITRSKMPSKFYSLKNTFVRGHTLNTFYVRLFLHRKLQIKSR